MWYLLWFVGVLLACSLAVLTGLWMDKKSDDQSSQ
jgi:cytochrome bd-I ubiquinol oxidase subunit X